MKSSEKLALLETIIRDFERLYGGQPKESLEDCAGYKAANKLLHDEVTKDFVFEIKPQS